MGLFGFFRRKDERAIPEPGSAEFERVVSGSAIPDSSSVDMGKPGWRSASSPPAPAAGAEVEVTTQKRQVDLRGTGAREEILNLMREKGLDPDEPGRIDATKVSGLREGILDVLKSQGVVISDGAPIPPAGGQGGWVGSEAAGDPTAQLEHLAKERDAGRITQAEFDAIERRLLGD